MVVVRARRAREHRAAEVAAQQQVAHERVAVGEQQDLRAGRVTGRGDDASRDAVRAQVHGRGDFDVRVVGLERGVDERPQQARRERHRMQRAVVPVMQHLDVAPADDDRRVPPVAHDAGAAGVIGVAVAENDQRQVAGLDAEVIQILGELARFIGRSRVEQDRLSTVDHVCVGDPQVEHLHARLFRCRRRHGHQARSTGGQRQSTPRNHVHNRRRSHARTLSTSPRDVQPR